MADIFYQSDYWLSRWIIQRGLGLVYLIAFIVALNQFKPLIGEKGLLPVPQFLQKVSFSRSPSVFHWHYSDRFFSVLSYIGALLALLAVFGYSDSGPVWLSMIVWLLLWAIYLSIVNVGQLFYGYGWESLLLEAGFYMIFIGPLHYYSPLLMIFILRWLVFRLEFGAGLIKMRGDICWKNLSCMNYHHETQPMPNPLSRFFHHLPTPLHKVETFFNHVVQLGAVWLLFLPQPLASIGAALIILSQSYLLISGNYAWLNFITLILAFSGVSDTYLQTLIPIYPPAGLEAPLPWQVLVITITLLVLYLSIDPVQNLLARSQRMNASFNPLHLVNTYGAFGSVTKHRYEIILEGTREEDLNDQTKWRAYEFKGKPGDPKKVPAQTAPYHLRLDWQMWFAALSSVQRNPWMVRLVRKLLKNHSPTVKLLKSNPFTDEPPTYIRARLFHYQFTTRKERKETGRWWKRKYKKMYLPPQSLKDFG